MVKIYKTDENQLNRVAPGSGKIATASRRIIMIEIKLARFEPRMTDRRRTRRTRSNSTEKETKPILPEEEWTEEEISEVSVQREDSRQLVMTSEIDQIRAELVFERGSALLESDYWDESHSWGSDEEEESDEYWHFLGRYE